MSTWACWNRSTISRRWCSTCWPSCRRRATRRAGTAIPRPEGPRDRSRSLRRSLLDEAVRVEHELLGRSLVEVLVALRRVVERDDGGVDRLGDLHAIVEDRLHEPVVVAHDRALAG